LRWFELGHAGNVHSNYAVNDMAGANSTGAVAAAKLSSDQAHALMHTRTHTA
jgi:hypothetical protein